ncbi:MAG TPA: glycerate kinase [Vicinamibacteria bacterium]|nr:glycerate kinase [Vicinamibacteria bacterium]
MLRRAVAAAEPYRLVRRQLARRGGQVEIAGVVQRGGRVFLVAAGKASVPMARAVEDALGERLAGGLVVSTAGEAALGRVRLCTAGHPVPDARGLAAAAEVEALAAGLRRSDLLLVLLSGGASALLPAPAEGLSLEDKAATTRFLLRAGATIQELNAVRKHLSRLKGGGLARAASPARVVTLALSDVVGDDLSTIASGPTVPDPTGFADALEVLRRRQVLEVVPAPVRARLERGARGEVAETPKAGDPVFRRTLTRVVGSNRLSLQAAAVEARRLGLRPLVLTSRLEGEAREAARVLVAVLRECVESGRPAATPVCLLAGGETTVTVRGDGQGGRNQELAVAASQALAGFPVPAVVASLATDGVDGASDAAGGVVDDTTVARAAAAGLAPADVFLAASDTRNFLGPVGDLILTGPTGTNVVDLVVLLAGRPAPRL